MLHTSIQLMATSVVAFVVLHSASCSDFKQIAIVDDERITESSGIAASYRYPGCVWLHNDSGDKPRLFLIDADGKTRATVKVVDADDFDWEDMCSFKVAGEPWLLIGDIGDNSRRRGKKDPKCRLYLLKEPVLPESKRGSTVDVDFDIRITLEYADGPEDCEGIAVDSERQEILMLTKSLPHKCRLYRVPLDLTDSKQKHSATSIAHPFIPFATALDISLDGRTMAIGSLLNGMIVRRQQAESWTDAFQRVGTAINLPPRKQGETICFDISGKWLFLNSEKKRQPLWRLKVPANGPHDASYSE